MKGFPRFFTKQVIIFTTLAFAVAIIDLALYVAFMVHESESTLSLNSPSSTVGIVNEQLGITNGVYILGQEGQAMLQEKQAWALLIAPDGTVAWSDGAPDEVVHPYSINDVALMSHYGKIGDWPAFIWSRDDGLLVMGFPKGSYAIYPTSGMPVETVRRVPWMVLVILSVDLIIFFGAYILTRRRTLKSIEPISEALDSLSKGRPVSVDLGGDMREVGGRINETSEIIRKKDSARASWIKGVSHDIRTPLAMIIGYADGIATKDGLPDDVSADAVTIRSQGMKIKDLVADLNAVSQLEYDMQPLVVEDIGIAGLLREITAEYLNGGLPDAFTLCLDISEEENDLVLNGDRRLIKRAVQNLVQNAITHNEEGVAITMQLRPDNAAGLGSFVIEVADDGHGMSDTEFAQLILRLSSAQNASAADNTAGSHGLGLVLVSKIAQAHGGSFSVSVTEGEGLRAALHLPMRHMR